MLDGDHTYFANGMLVHNKMASCNNSGSACALPWGGSINSGYTVRAFAAASAPNCNVSSNLEIRSCVNGVLSGSFTHRSCTSTTGFVWQPSPSAGGLTGPFPPCPFGAIANAPCTSLGSVCALGASYLFCAPPGDPDVLACRSPWGVGNPPIPDGASITAYSAANAPDCNIAAVKQTRTCNAGVLSGTFDKESCAVGGGDCPSEGLGNGEGNLTGGPGCTLTSCCNGSIVVTNPGMCPALGYTGGAGNCTAPP
jgi:hypothetical protein